MTSRPLTDDRLTSALRAISPAAAQPGLRDRISVAVQATPQRHRRWFVPVGLGGRRNLLVATGFLLALALAATAIVGILSQKHDDPLPGRRGTLAFVRDGDVYLAAPDGTGVVLAAHIDGTPLRNPRWSPDGNLLAIQTDEPAVVLFDPRTSTLRRLAGGNLHAWSPDGTQLLVAVSQAESVIVDVATGTSRALPWHPGPLGFETSLAWSPDSRWVAIGTCCGPSQLIRVDAATGDVADLDTGVLDGTYIAAWSPDSTRIAFVEGRERRSDLPRPLTVADVDGSNRIELAGADLAPGRPHWSPDGAWIAFEARDRLMVVRPDGTDARTVASVAGEIVGWSPDGATVAVATSTPDGGSGLVDVTVADGSTQPVSVPIGAAQFTWAVQPASALAFVPPTAPIESPPASDAVPGRPPAETEFYGTGPANTLVFSARSGTPSGDEVCEAFVLRLPVAARPVWPNMNTTNASNPVCSDVPAGDHFNAVRFLSSPDGTAFAQVLASEGGTVEVFGLDGVTRSGAVSISGDVAWSPDGSWLSAQGCPAGADCSGGWFLFRPDGSDVRQLPGRPVWSADGVRLSVETGEDRLLVGRPDGSDLVDVGAYPLPEGWAPDGQQFAVIRDGNVWLVGADGSDASDLTRFVSGGVTDASWAPDGRWIAVLRGDTLVVVDPASGTQRRLGSGYAGSSLAWRPDGSSLAATRSDGNAVLFDADTWKPTLLESLRLVAWSPDGEYLAGIVSGTSPDALVVVNADGSGRHVFWLGNENSGASVDSLIWAP